MHHPEGAAAGQQVAAIWQVSSGEKSRSPSCKSTEPPVAPDLCFVDGGLVWVEGRHGFGHGRLRFRDSDVPGGAKKDLDIEHAGPLDCTPDGKTVVVGSDLYKGKLTVLRFPGGRRVRRWDLPSHARRVAVSHDGRFVAHDFDRLDGVHIRRVEDGSVVRKLQKPPGGWKPGSMALSPGGDYLALGGEDGALKVWARSRPRSC